MTITARDRERSAMNTHIWKAALAATVMMTTGCLFTGDDPSDVDKEEAATLMNADPDVIDYCALNGWYNDGECDTFCRQADIDCGGEKGCEENADCADGEFCKKADGACGAEGACAAVPDSWTEEYAPVCGCDGQTYGNGGAAAGSGVSIDYAGECDALECQPEDCGPMPDTQRCPNGEGPTITCVPEGGGCGWDIGRCETETFCGGFAEDECAEDEFCGYEAGDGCGFDDGGSVCKPRPESCPEIYSPVCGCDGQTYGNACSANAAGVGIFEAGACEEPGYECGGPEGLSCDRGQYCELFACGEPDAGGSCQERPLGGCPENYDPVCSCDGTTYGNECEAASAGATVSYPGECGELPEPCDEDECGMKPGGVPDRICDDGTIAGLECVQRGGGVCGWEMAECPMEQKLCGGFAGETCDPRSEYCHYREGETCGFADGLGECRSLSLIHI